MYSERVGEDPRPLSAIMMTQHLTPMQTRSHESSSLFRLVLFFMVVAGLTSLSAQPEYEANEKLPPIPAVDGPLKMEIIYPEEGGFRPNVKRNFIFGSTGNGRATVTVNGTDVRVAPNGAFLGFLPVEGDGYEVIATLDGVSDTARYEYTLPGEWKRPTVVRDLQERAISGEVTFGADTLASGSGIAYGARTKRADREWMFPIGARFPVLERNGDHFRIDLAGQEAWVEAEYVTTTSASPEPHELGVMIDLRDADRWVDLTIPVAHAPFRIEGTDKSITMVFYNVLSYELEQRLAEAGSSGSASTEQVTTWSVSNLPNLVVRDYSWSAVDGTNAVSLRIDLRHALWGFKVFYNDVGQVVLRVRRPNATSSRNPLQGLVIMVDAGHPPRGASGPTGLTEADANLAIALAIERKLIERGAHVEMTRRDSLPLLTNDDVSAELTARVDYAVEVDADILLSIHNNGFSDGIDPWERNGTETYYYHDFASELARTLHEEIVEVTGVPSLGFKQRSLALIRPTWMPAVLTESLYMMHPQQEQALRDPAFIERLAEAHVVGLERFVRERAGTRRSRE